MSMKIRVSGFELRLHKKIAIDDLASKLQAVQKSGRFAHGGHSRILKIARQDGFLLGSICTDRGHRKYSQVDEKTDEMSIGSLAPGKSLSAFNFFVIAKKSGRGLLAHYKESGGLPFFCGVLDTFMRLVLNEKRESAKKAGDTKSIKKEFSGEALDWGQIVNSEQYEAILNRWKKIRFLELVYYTPEKASDYVPINPVIKTVAAKVIFESKAENASLIGCIKGMIRRDKEKADVARIEGVNEFGAEDKINVFGEIPDWFNVLNYDTIIGNETLFDPDLKKSVLIKALLQEVKDRPALFY